MLVEILLTGFRKAPGSKQVAFKENLFRILATNNSVSCTVHLILLGQYNRFWHELGYERLEMSIRFWLGNVLESCHLLDLQGDGKTTLRWFIQTQVMRVRGGLNGLRILSSGGLWDMNVGNFGFYIVPTTLLEQNNNMLPNLPSHSSCLIIHRPAIRHCHRQTYNKSFGRKIQSNKQWAYPIIPHVLTVKPSSDSLYEE
jgi:hypothetical protein